MNIYNGIQEVLQSIDEVIKNIEEGRWVLWNILFTTFY
jgi:hypothetical protein